MPALAEDAVQELFIRFWTRRQTLKTIDNFSAYMKISLRNLLINELEKLSTRRRIELNGIGLLIPPATPGQSAEAADLYRLVQQAVATLSPQQQHIYRLSRETHLGTDAIAAELNLSSKTVANNLSLALGHIRNVLRSHGYLLIFIL